MIRSLVLLKMLLLVQIGFCQEVFQRSYGGFGSEYGRGVIECSTGGYLIVGSTNSYLNPSTDVYLLRVDELGEYLWGRNIGASDKIDWGMDLVEDAEGNFIIAGYTDDSPSGSYDALLIKTNSEGNIIWRKTFGGDDWDFIETMAITNNSEVVIAGSKTVQGNSKGWILKTDSNGDQIWETIISSSSQLKLTGIDICEDENLVFTGYSTNNLLDTKTFIAGKLNQNGEIVWTSDYQALGAMESGKCVCNSDAVLGIGTKLGFDNYTQLTLSSIDHNTGNLNWFRSLVNPEPNAGLAIDTNNSGNILVAGGIKEVIGSDYSAISFEFNSLGQDISSEYAVLQGSIGEDVFYDITSVSDGGYICVGHSTSFGNNYQVLLSKIGSNGERDLSNTDFLDLATILKPTKQEGSINLYPNPAEHFINIELDNSQALNYRITNSTGQQIQTGVVNTAEERQINISQLPVGLYFISLSGDKDILFFSRFIKLH